MASFTDSSVLDKLTTFNPYVQQLPVDAMVKVGMQKQEQYNQGVQKIQTAIDNIAGLDIAKDADKAYLQSKINELGNNLKFVAAGDFSDFQLVNSVNGMTNQLVKDSNVQNAVASTAKYRKELSIMEEAKKKGELTPDNKYVFDKQASAWLNNSEIGATFNASYTPYFDVFKFTKETFDAVKPDGYSYDQIFETDAAGNPKVDGRGNPILSTTMVRLEKEGIFPEKVKATLAQVFSDPRVSQQLNISGQYNYRGFDSKALEQKITSQREDVMAGLADRLMDLNLKKSMGENVDDQIDAVQSQINKTSSSYDELSQLAYDNPDNVRGMLYKDDVSSKYTTMFGWSKTKQQTLDNPAWKAEFDMQKEANLQSRWAQEQRYKRERDKIGDAKWQAEFEQRERLALAKKKPTPGTETNLGEPAPESAAFNEIQFHDNQMQEASSNYVNASNAFIWETVLSKQPGMMEAVNKYVSQSTKPREEAQAEIIDILINNGAKKQKMDPEAFRTTWLNKATQEYNKGGKNINPVYKDLYQNYRNKTKEYKAVLSIDKQIQTGLKNQLGKVADKISFANIPTQRIKIGNNIFELTKDDMFDISLATTGSTLWETLTGSDSGKVLDREAEAAKARLLKKGKGALLKAYQDDNPGIFTLKRDGVYKKNINLWKGIDTIREFLIDDDFKQGLAKKAELITKAYGKSPNRSFSVVTGDASIDKTTFANIKRMAGTFSTVGNLSGDFKSFLPSLGKNIEDSNLEYRATVDESGNPAVEVISYDADGEREGGMTVTPDQARTLGIDVNEIYESKEVITTRNLINNSPIFSTSAGDPAETSTYINGDSRFDNSDFPSMKKSNFNVQANIIYSSGKYYPFLYMKDTSTKNPGIVKPLAGSEDLNTLINTLKSTVTPSLVQSYLLQ